MESGGSPDDLVRSMSAAKYEVVFQVLSSISDELAEGSGPHWTDFLVGLHEDLLSADPTGGEGQDLFA